MIEFVPSDSLVQELFGASDCVTIRLSPSQSPSLESEGRSERVKECVAQGMGRILALKGRILALDKVPFAIVSENDVFMPEYVQEISNYFRIDPVSPVLTKLCTEYRHYVENNRLDCTWGRLTVDTGRIVLTAPPPAIQVPAIRPRAKCRIL